VVLCGRTYRSYGSPRKIQVKRPVAEPPNLLADEDLPSAPRQKRSLAKRERLKAAALASFAESGYEHTSIDQIARRAKLAVGGFYLHFRSKRQLLLALMDELLHELARLDLRGSTSRSQDPRTGLHDLLTRAFSTDVHYAGAYRAWREASFSDPDLAKKQQQIHTWTSARVAAVFTALQQLPGARTNVDIAGLSRVMDTYFWSLLAQASQLSPKQLKQAIDAATHLMYHAVFTDS
jgi:AcrR family transcriptional regulator